MTKNQFILSEVAKIAGVKPHVVAYGIAAGNISESKLRIAGKRIFSTKEVEAIKKYFANKQREATNAPK